MSNPSQGTSSPSVPASAVPLALVLAGSLVTSALTGGCARQTNTTQTSPEQAETTDADVNANVTAGTDVAGDGTIADETDTETVSDVPDGQAEPSEGQDGQDEVGMPAEGQPADTTAPVVATAGPEDPATIIDDDMFRIEVVDRHVNDGHRSSTTYAKLIVTNKTDRILGLRCLGDWTRSWDDRQSNPLSEGPDGMDVPQGVIVELDVDAIWGYAPGQMREVWIITDVTGSRAPETGYVGIEGTFEAYEGIGSPEDYEAPYMYEFEGESEHTPKRAYHIGF